MDFATNYEALPSAENLFKVNGLRGEYEVRIDKMECTCRAWQLSGIPCRHACATFRHERIKPESAVHKCYSLDAFRAAYGGVIMPCSDPKMWKKMNGPEMRPPKFDKQVGRPSKKRRKSPLEEEGGTRLSRHGIIGHCSVCNEPGHTKRKCPELGRAAGQQAAAPQEAPPAATQYAPQEAPLAAPQEAPLAAAQYAPQEAAAPQEAPHEVPQHAPAIAQHAQPPMKMPVKRKSSAKKKIVHQMATSATASIVESAMSYSFTSSSVIHVLQEQAIATQQSQTAPPGPLPESQFIASCRDELPPPRPPTKTLGLKKKKKQQVSKKKENQVPDV